MLTIRSAHLHHLRRLAAEQERPGHVRLQHAPHRREGREQRVIHGRDTRVVHEHVEPTVLLSNVREQPVDLGLVRHAQHEVLIAVVREV
jgi:hypothetical protein